jgi:hypothetical protein
VAGAVAVAAAGGAATMHMMAAMTRTFLRTPAAGGAVVMVVAAGVGEARMSGAGEGMGAAKGTMALVTGLSAPGVGCLGQGRQQRRRSQQNVCRTAHGRTATISPRAHRQARRWMQAAARQRLDGAQQSATPLRAPAAPFVARQVPVEQRSAAASHRVLRLPRQMAGCLQMTLTPILPALTRRRNRRRRFRRRQQASGASSLGAQLLLAIRHRRDQVPRRWCQPQTLPASLPSKRSTQGPKASGPARPMAAHLHLPMVMMELRSSRSSLMLECRR